MGRKRTNLEEFLRELRNRRIRKYGIEAVLIGIDGMNSVGKSRQIYHAKSYVEREHSSVPIRDVRESQELSEENIRARESHIRQVRESQEIEDLDEVLKFYTDYRIKAWERIITQEYIRQKGIVILERSVNSTYILNALFRRIDPNSQEAIDLARRVYDHEPIIPPHISLIIINDVNVVLKKAEEEAKTHGSEDLFDTYQYVTAYKRMHNGKKADPNTMARWWLTATKGIYTKVGRELPDSHIITIGRDFEKVNPITKEVLSRVCQEVEYNRHI